jgi:hypothetical protein
VKTFVRARSARLEFATPFRRAVTALAPVSPLIASAIPAGAARAHAEVNAVFDPEIRQLVRARRSRLTALLIAACSWPLWECLRVDLNLSHGRARETMTAMVAAVIERELKVQGAIAV